MFALKIVIGVISLVAALGCVAWFVPSTVTVTRSFRAPPERLWALWEQPEAIRHWWGPSGYTAPRVQSELKPGVSYQFVMRSAGGAETANVGTYLEIEPRKRIVQTMSFADSAGRPLPGASVPLPGKWPDQIIVTTEFVATNGRTEVRIREEGIPLIMKLFASMGWQQQFDKIETLLH